MKSIPPSAVNESFCEALFGRRRFRRSRRYSPGAGLTYLPRETLTCCGRATRNSCSLAQPPYRAIFFEISFSLFDYQTRGGLDGIFGAICIEELVIEFASPSLRMCAIFDPVSRALLLIYHAPQQKNWASLVEARPA